MGTTELLTVKEVANPLRLGGKATDTVAKNGKLAAFTVGEKSRVRRVDLDDWSQSRIAADSPRRLGGAGRAADAEDERPAMAKGGV